MAKFRRFIRDNYILVFTILVLYHVLIGFATYHVFTNMTEVSAAVATCFSVLLGLPASTGILVFWQKDDRNGES